MYIFFILQNMNITNECIGCLYYRVLPILQITPYVPLYTCNTNNLDLLTAFFNQDTDWNSDLLCSADTRK